MTIVFTCLGFALLLAAAHPFLTYPASLIFVRRLQGRRLCERDASVVDSVPPAERCAICLCAYNEAASIGKKINDLLRISEKAADLGIRVRIYVYADGCQDETVTILKSFGDQIVAVVSDERRGKSAGMNRLLDKVEEPFVVFTDANVIFDDSAISSLLKRFNDQEVGCVVGNLLYTNQDETPTATTGSLYWRFEEALKQLESDTGSVMGADGSIFAIRRRLFRAVPEDMIDDMFTSMNILCDGFRVVRAADAIAYEKSATSSRDEYRRKVRIACRCFNCHRRLWWRLLKLGPWNQYKYFSHKFLRWNVFFWLLASLICFLAAAVSWHLTLAICLMVTAAIPLILSILMQRNRWVRCGREVLIAFYATATGVVLSLMGEKFRTWEPVETAR